MQPDNISPVNNPPSASEQTNSNASGINISDLFGQIAEKIIERQEAIIGPVAIEQASRIPELVINWPQHAVQISGDLKAVIDELVDQYRLLFGQISVEVSKEAVSQILANLPPDQLPDSLK